MKLNNLTIENFRSFDHFTLNHLGRVNLLVGTNNSGKTSVLEAASVLMSSSPLSSVWNLLWRRGEVFPGRNRAQANVPTELSGDVRHLFPNHVIMDGSSFRIGGDSDGGSVETTAQIGFDESQTTPIGGYSPPGFDPPGFTPPGFNPEALVATLSGVRLALTLSAARKGSDNEKPEIIEEAPLDQNGGLDPASWNRGPVFAKTWRGNHAPYFLSANSLSSQAIARLYNDIILTAEEDLVLEAVRLISPQIKRIAPVGAGTEWSGLPARDGIFVRLEGVDDRVPLGSMGEGIWRMLGLALAVVHSQNKILLIDEVDTGLHHTVMGKMWRFLDACSQRFNVQIIATTHSRDCYQSLAEICDADRDDPSQITMQRIDRTRNEAVAYSEAAIIAAAERDIEVR